MITKCSGANCPIKDQCKRFDKWSSFHDIIHPPFTVKDGIFSCSMYWGIGQTNILSQLLEITGIKTPDAYCDGYCQHSEHCDRIECKL